MEKDYLHTKNIQFEEILVDQNPAAAEEMVKISNHMGVPFTVITKDDGTQVTILGFDKRKTDETLGI